MGKLSRYYDPFAIDLKLIQMDMLIFFKKKLIHTTSMMWDKNTYINRCGQWSRLVLRKAS